MVCNLDEAVSKILLTPAYRDHIPVAFTVVFDDAFPLLKRPGLGIVYERL